MKSLLLKNEIIIKKPIVFLCGAFYTGKDNDKRKILLDYILNESNNGVYPLIVDNFLSENDIEENDFTIERYEELVANVSFANYIFLESFSSSSELGLFSSNTSQAMNFVFYPDGSNLILDKIGYFVRSGILGNASKNIVSSSYVAQVDRYAYGSDFVDEHYYFFNNHLPSNISKIVSESIESLKSNKHELKFEISDSIPFSLGMFVFRYNSKLNRMYVSPRTIFYMLYTLIISKNNIEDILTLDVSSIYDDYYFDIKNIVVDSFLHYEKRDILIDDFDLTVISFESAKLFIKYCSFFIKYLSESMLSKKKIKKTLLTNFNDVFFKVDEYSLLEERIIEIPSEIKSISKSRSIKKFVLYKNRKSRNIIAYNMPEGIEFYNVHKTIKEGLETFAFKHKIYSSNSYAYKKGLNTLACISMHINGRYFLKLDIHNFFESMKVEVVLECMLKSLSNNDLFLSMTIPMRDKFKRNLQQLFLFLTYNSVFPVGFVTSPIVSEIYLNSFDKIIKTYCEENSLVYTRYADDILISSESSFEFGVVEKMVQNELNRLSLELNVKKTKMVEFKNVGDSLNYIGLNIVYKKDKNVVSVGKTYIKKLAKMKCFENKDDYIEKKIRGLESYLKYNDPSGYDLYLKIVNIYSHKTN